MEKMLSVTMNKERIYDIVFARSFDELPTEISKLKVEDKKICIVTDSRVEQLYAKEVRVLLENICARVVCFSFPEGEKSKTLQTVQSLYEFLIKEGFDRNDLLLALGGGVVGDLTGYTAATYLRGIDFIQVPTTLLSQVDSSIGGKTGVDFLQYKNMVGAFHMPKLVYTNLQVLKDLNNRQFFSGMAEVLKAGLIKNASFYEWLITHFNEIGDKDMDILEEMIYRSCEIKKHVVEGDPMEKGERALLNFGHTLGHAIEKWKNFSLLHGECVALGCVCAAFISWKHELLSMEEYYEIRDMFVPFALPITIENINPDEIVSLTQSDKKMESGTIKFILLKKAGKAIIDKTVTEEDMLLALNEIFVKEEDMYE